MDGFSKFENIINALVWKQPPAPTLNYLCLTPDCHSTCVMKHSFAGIFLLWPRQFSRCPRCKHSHLSHFHLSSTWEQVYESQLSIDYGARKRWEAAKDDKERTEALIATSRKALEDLGRVIDDAMYDLAGLAEEYAKLALSGSFSAPLEKAISLLELWCRRRQEKGVGSEVLKKIRTTLDDMKQRRDLLRNAEEKARGRVWRIERAKARKVEEKVNRTNHTIEGGLQEEVLNIWGTIKEKVLAGFRK